MICWRRLISGLTGALFFAGIVRGDIVPMFMLDTGRLQPLCVCERTEVEPTNLSYLYDSSIVDGFSLGTIQFLPMTGGDIGQSVKMPHSIELKGEPGSISLCLYSLMGLGLCSVHNWIRRLSLNHITEWYHNGGPFQIGHSLAVSPESLCSAPAYCFVEPDGTMERLTPQIRLRTIVSSWRQSQFTPDIIAPRGPPI